MASIYFDNNATTELDARVLNAMLPYLSHQYGNATSRHVYGRSAKQAIERAREQVADAVSAHPSQVVFTASGTETNNFAVRGISRANQLQKIAVSRIEHPCVSRPAQALAQAGIELNQIGVDNAGRIELDQVAESLQQGTQFLSLMLANNETGVLQPVAAAAELAKQQRAWIHSDAVQALGKVKVDFNALNLHAMTISSHKIGGPQGAAALILDKRVDIQALLLGGGQEKGLRSGTENLAAIVGFGAACELISQDMLQATGHIRHMRDLLETGLHKLGAVIFASAAERLPNTSFFAFAGIEGETLVMALDRKGFAVASGSACSSDSTEPSHVLLAMGVEADLARGAIRVSLSAANTVQQIEAFLLVLKSELARLQGLTAIAG
jgi:cysteine desulfurase